MKYYIFPDITFFIRKNNIDVTKWYCMMISEKSLFVQSIYRGIVYANVHTVLDPVSSYDNKEDTCCLKNENYLSYIDATVLKLCFMFK